jgi:hypothetical protein
VGKRLAREIAQQHSQKLPTFPSRRDAEQHLFAFRDKHLALLSQILHKHPELNLDYTPSSLKQLELWYFHLYENDSFEALGISRETFEICMAMYFGETVIRNTSAQWIVEEYFLAPGKYELGIQRDPMSIMLYRFTDHFRTPNNKKKQSLFRRYKQYF